MGAPNPGLIFMLQIVGIGLVFYFLCLRPQAKARKQASDMLAALKKGDEVTTSGGIVGKVTRVEDQIVAAREPVRHSGPHDIDIAAHHRIAALVDEA